MGHLGQACFCVFDPATACDMGGLVGVRFPKCRLVHPIGFAQNAFGKTKSLEHLDRPACDTVRLTHLQRPRFLVDDAGRDIREGRQLRRKRQTRWATADDQDIHLTRQFFDMRLSRGGSDMRTARFETVQVILHLIVLHFNMYTYYK